MSQDLIRIFYMVYRRLSEVCYHSGPEPLSIAEMLLVSLQFLGNQDALRVFADKFGRTESTVYNVIGMVSQFFFDHHQSNFITMPRTRREIKCNEDEFQSGIPGVIGAIDGSHMTFHPKKREHEILSKSTAVLQFCSDGDCQS